MNKSPQCNQQTEPSSASLKMRKFVFTKIPGKWPSYYQYLKINSRFHATRIPSNNI